MKCKTGKRLIHQWAEQVRTARMDNWESIMMGNREYDKHKRKCKVCGKDRK